MSESNQNISAVKFLLSSLIFLFSPFSYADVKSNEQTTSKSQFSGSIEFTTDYVFRGESETADGDVPAIKTSITWTSDSGWYAGLFGANNKFESTPEISIVIGPYLGKKGKFSQSDWSYNVFLFHYSYPDTQDLDYSELWIEITKKYELMDLKFEITPTLNDWFGVDGWKGVNYAIHSSMDLPDDYKLTGAFGKQVLDGNNAEGWYHWNLGINFSIDKLTFDIRYHDTDVDSTHLVYGSPQGLRIFDSRTVFSVSTSF